MDLDGELKNFLGERELLLRGIVREFRKGHAAQSIADRVQAAHAFSRDKVLEYLRAIKIHDAARKALAEAGLTGVADVSVSGIDPPRGAWIHLCVDPAERPDFEDLPRLIREALAPYLITLAASDEEDTSADERLLSSEKVRLAKVKPRA